MLNKTAVPFVQYDGKKDDEKKDSEDSKIAVPSDNPYDKEVNERNDMRISEHKLREFIRAVIRESIKFDHDKVQKNKKTGVFEEI